MILGDLVGLKLPDICLTGEENPWENLTQETCPDRGSNPGPLRDRWACYHLTQSGGHKLKKFRTAVTPTGSIIYWKYCFCHLVPIMRIKWSDYAGSTDTVMIAIHGENILNNKTLISSSVCLILQSLPLLLGYSPAQTLTSSTHPLLFWKAGSHVPKIFILFCRVAAISFFLFSFLPSRKH